MQGHGTKTSFKQYGEKQMKISKRHLKRIIREEYSRLKRRGLIKEANEFYVSESDPIVMEIIDIAKDAVQRGKPGIT